MAPWGRYLLMFFVTGLVVIGVYAAAFVYQLGAPVEAEYWIPEMKIVKCWVGADDTAGFAAIEADAAGM